MEVLIIPFKWDFRANIFLENDGFSMGRKSLWGSSILDFCWDKQGKIEWEETELVKENGLAFLLKQNPAEARSYLQNIISPSK